MRRIGYPTSCEAFSYGEVEDYTVVISTSANYGIMDDNANVNAEFTLYPNPVKQILNISLLDAVGKDYTIYNVVGQVVGKGAFSESLDVSSLQSGVYILEINTDNDKMMKRFIKE